MYGRMRKFDKDVFCFDTISKTPITFVLYKQTNQPQNKPTGKKDGIVYRDLNLCIGELDITLSSVTHILRVLYKPCSTCAHLGVSKGLSFGTERKKMWL